MLSIPNPSKNTKRKLAKAPPKRKQVGGGGRDVGKEEGRKRRDMIDASRRRKGRGSGAGSAPNTNKARAKGKEINMDE